MGVNYETHRDIVVFIFGCSTTDGPTDHEMDIILFMHVNQCDKICPTQSPIQL